MANKKVIKERKLGWYMKAPVRFLSKVRDAYVDGMNRLNPHVFSMDAAFGCPAGLPRSFSAGLATSSSAAEDYRELVRASSVPHYRSAGLDLSSVSQKQTGTPSQVPPAKASEMAVPGGRIVGVGIPSQTPPSKGSEMELPHFRSAGFDLSSISQKQTWRPAKASEMTVPGVRGVGIPSQTPPSKASEMEVPRSRSVGVVGIRMARINEDEPCEFDDDLKTMPLVQARSRSYTVGRSCN